jgi:tRNA A-37 threonylcarbamoyl transferase component Bud32
MSQRPRLDTKDRLSLARAQLFRGWLVGRCPSVEHVLTDFAELTSDVTAIADLVHTEAVLRAAKGQALDLDALAQRFPSQMDEIRRLLALDPYLTSELATVAPRPATAASCKSGPPQESAASAPVADAPGEPVTGEDDAVKVEVIEQYPRVPGYEILNELGRGGMGVVYRARHVKLHRDVALKMILAGAAGEMDRFRVEAEALARLQHPGIVQIHEIGEVDPGSGAPCPYLSLEFCPGGSLTGKLDSYRQPRQAAELVRTLALAIHAAHRKKIIHRDLKPGNVLLAEDGTPKITDFGLARVAREGESSGKTRTGAVMGTPSYMAPEQAAGKTHDLGPSCDVYALGAILYECLTGKPPFEAPTVLDTLMMVIEQEPVPPRQRNSRIPRDLDTICLKCLEKDARNRYSTAADLADDLDRHLSDEPIRARPPGPVARMNRWVRKHPALLIAYGVLALSCVFLRLTDWMPANLPGVSVLVPNVLVLPMGALVLHFVVLAEMRWTLLTVVLLGLPVGLIARWTTLREDPPFAFFVLASSVGMIAVLVGCARIKGIRALLWFFAWTLLVGILPLLALLVFALWEKESIQHALLVRHGPALVMTWLAVMADSLILGMIALLVSWASRRGTSWIVFGAVTGTVAGLYLVGRFDGPIYAYMTSNGWRGGLRPAYYLEFCLAYTGAVIAALLAPAHRTGGDHVVPSEKSTRTRVTSMRSVASGGMTDA